MHKCLTVYIDELCAHGTNLLSYECTVDLRWECNTSWMIL